jgi:hypothetical protein
MAHHQHAVGFAVALNTSIFIVVAVASPARPQLCSETFS